MATAGRVKINNAEVDYATEQGGLVHVRQLSTSDLSLAALAEGLAHELGVSDRFYEDWSLTLAATGRELAFVHASLDGSMKVETRAPSCGTVIPIEDFRSVAESILWEKGMQLRWVQDSGLDPACWEYEFTGRLGVKVCDLVSMINRVDQTARFPPPDHASPTSVLAMLSAGLPDNMIGLRENEWLDGKSFAYDFARDGNRARHELGLAVARFANHIGGLLVIGVKTRIIAGAEQISSLAPLPLDNARIDSYQKTIYQWVYPQVDGLELHRIPSANGEIVAILVPPQTDSNKPYLVRGGFVEGKFEEATISIVRRRGDGTIPVTPASIHATLAAGRALLSRGVIPGS